MTKTEKTVAILEQIDALVERLRELDHLGQVGVQVVAVDVDRDVLGEMSRLPGCRCETVLFRDPRIALDRCKFHVGELVVQATAPARAPMREELARFGAVSDSEDIVTIPLGY